MHFVTFALCLICILSYLHFVSLHYVSFVFFLHLQYDSFASCLSCISSCLHFVIFTLCRFCILSNLHFVLFLNFVWIPHTVVDFAFVTNVLCLICNLSYLHFFITLCLISISACLPFVPFAFCCNCILSYLNCVGFAFCHLFIFCLFAIVKVVFWLDTDLNCLKPTHNCNLRYHFNLIAKATTCYEFAFNLNEMFHSSECRNADLEGSFELIPSLQTYNFTLTRIKEG